MLEKLRAGYTGFLEKIGEVQADDRGAIPKKVLASSEAMQCFGLSDAEYIQVTALIPNVDGECVVVKDVFQQLGHLMHVSEAPCAHTTVVTRTDGFDSSARLAWTTFDSSEAIIVAGTSEGGLVVFHLKDGCEICRFHETMQPRNGHDMAIDRRSPVMVRTNGGSVKISGALLLCRCSALGRRRNAPDL